MKKLILALLVTVSASAFAEKESIVFPRVYNYGSSVQVQVWNHTDRSVNCSGFVNITLQSGKRESEYYFDFVSARFTSYRTFYMRDLNDRVSFVNHSIFCH